MFRLVDFAPQSLYASRKKNCKIFLAFQKLQFFIALGVFLMCLLMLSNSSAQTRGNNNLGAVKQVMQ